MSSAASLCPALLHIISPLPTEYDPEQGLPNPDAGENKETGNVIGGLKASNANPGHSDEAKANNTARLNEMAENGQQGANTE